MHSSALTPSSFVTAPASPPSPSLLPRARGKRVRDVALRHGAWHPSEDARLLALVSAHGAAHWREIAARIPGRTGKQARERWMNQLAPSVKRGGGWSEDEDQAVVLLQGVHGNRWSFIAAGMEGRTDNGIKNRFNSTLKRKRDAGFYDVWLAKVGYARREVVQEKVVIGGEWGVQGLPPSPTETVVGSERVPGYFGDRAESVVSSDSLEVAMGGGNDLMTSSQRANELFGYAHIPGVDMLKEAVCADDGVNNSSFGRRSQALPLSSPPLPVRSCQLPSITSFFPPSTDPVSLPKKYSKMRISDLLS